MPTPAQTRATSEPNAAEVLSVRLDLAIEDEQVTFEALVPRAPTRPRRLLPLLQALTEEIVDRAERRIRAEGATVSCKVGCGACCRHLVMVSKTEAHHFRDLVEAMPEPRRTEVRGRFAEVRRRLQEGGLGALVRGAKGADEAKLDPDRIAGDYFALGIPCPFLEAESCSVHADRPLLCREYLVTSPSELCKEHPPEQLARVPLAARVSESLQALDRRDGDGVGWIPLSVALQWAEENPDVGRAVPGPDLVRDLLKTIAPKTRKKRKKR